MLSVVLLSVAGAPKLEFKLFLTLKSDVLTELVNLNFGRVAIKCIDIRERRN
jgi:hypothetical protein